MVRAIPISGPFNVKPESWTLWAREYGISVITQDEDEITPTHLGDSNELFESSWHARIMMRRVKMLKQSIRILEVDISGSECAIHLIKCEKNNHANSVRRNQVFV